MKTFEWVAVIDSTSKFGKLMKRFFKNKNLNEKIRLFNKAKLLNMFFATKRIAIYSIWDNFYNLSGHTCYRNDAFYMAFHCGLHTLNKYSSGLIKNGMLGYFEKVTHDGLPLFQLLQDEGFVEADDLKSVLESKNGRYYFLSPKAVFKIAEACKMSKKEVEWIAFKICFSLVNYDSSHPSSEFDLDCSPSRNHEFVMEIANKYLSVKMKTFLVDYLDIKIPTEA
ncbi:MAG: hypothetical protein WC264_03030 [Candidatus Paceibacterota bacterium]|jgi:hypothetical protein